MSVCRSVATILALVGYYIMLNDNLIIGLALKLTASILFTCIFTKHRMYDLLILTAVYTAIDLNKLFELLL